MEDKYTAFKKCSKCMGIRSQADFSKLSVDDQIKALRELDEQDGRIMMERNNLRLQCKHERLSKQRWYYNRWDGEWEDYNLSHKVGEDGDSHVWCAVCDKDFGWECPKNPKGYCEYPSSLAEEAKYGTTILYCAHCKRPKDRMGHYSTAMLGGKYDPTYEPSKEEVEEYLKKMSSKLKVVPYMEMK